MSNLVVSTLVDTFMQSADLPAAQATLGISNGLPVWAFQAGGGTPTSGNFTTDSATIQGTSSITFNAVNDYGTSGAFLNYIVAGPFGTTLILTGSNNVPFYFAVTAFTQPSGNIQFTVSPFDTGSWAEDDYKMSFAPRGSDIADNVVLTVNSIAPDNAGNVALTIQSALTASGITTFTQFLSIFGITAAASGTTTPVTSITISDGSPTNVS